MAQAAVARPAGGGVGARSRRFLFSALLVVIAVAVLGGVWPALAGWADPVRGTGLIGLKDRVEALGGTTTVHSPVGAGTSLQVELPLID